MPAKKTLRVVTGSYEHNLLGVALTFDERPAEGARAAAEANADGNTRREAFTPLFHFSPHTQSIRCLAWSRKVLASGSNDEWIRLYDLQRRREMGTLMHQQGQILCMQFFGNKWFLSGAGDGKICLWRVKDWELLAELKVHKAPVLDLSVHPSGRLMLSVGVDRKLVLWNLMTARKASVRKLREAPVQVSFVPGPKTASDYVIGYDRKVVRYTANGTAAQTWEFASRVHRVGWATVDQLYLVVSTEDGKLSFAAVGEAPTQGNAEEETEPKKKRAKHDTKTEVEATKETKETKDETEPIAFTLQGHATRVKDFAVFETYLASVSTDGNIVVWDLEARSQVGVYHAGDRLNCVALMPDDVERIDRSVPDEKEEVEELSEPEEALPVPKKKKKARVVVTRK